MKHKGNKCLSFTQRLQLEAYLKAGLHKRDIAEKLGVHISTVYNELKRGYCVHDKCYYVNWFGEKKYKKVVGYNPKLAEQKYRFNLTSHGPTLKVGDDYDFIRYVEKRVLQDKISPCAVLGEIKRNNLFKTNISKTTLYRYIEQGVFLGLTMSDCPMGKKRKCYRKPVAKRPPKGTSIERRPLEIAKRVTFGHWEMDCVVGKKNIRDILLVLTERLTRYEIIIKMPNRKPETVVKSLNKLERRFGKRFRKVFKSITVDNGVEFSDFKNLEKSIYGGTRTNVYYCHPYTSCERGSNERINRDIRRLIPKGADLSLYSIEEIQRVENWVNSYPREIFNFATSKEMFLLQLQTL